MPIANCFSGQSALQRAETTNLGPPNRWDATRRVRSHIGARIRRGASAPPSRGEPVDLLPRPGLVPKLNLPSCLGARTSEPGGQVLAETELLDLRNSEVSLALCTAFLRRRLPRARLAVQPRGCCCRRLRWLLWTGTQLWDERPRGWTSGSLARR